MATKISYIPRDKNGQIVADCIARIDRVKQELRSIEQTLYSIEDVGWHKRGVDLGSPRVELNEASCYIEEVYVHVFAKRIIDDGEPGE